MSSPGLVSVLSVIFFFLFVHLMIRRLGQRFQIHGLLFPDEARGNAHLFFLHFRIDGLKLPEELLFLHAHGNNNKLVPANAEGFLREGSLNDAAAFRISSSPAS